MPVESYVHKGYAIHIYDHSRDSNLPGYSVIILLHEKEIYDSEDECRRFVTLKAAQNYAQQFVDKEHEECQNSK